MAQGFIPLNPKVLQTPEGVNQLNRMLETLFNLLPHDGEKVKFVSGYGSPENNIAAGVGSIYMRLDGGANTSIYIKESGTEATGWIAK